MLRLYDFQCPSCGETIERLVQPDEKVRCLKCQIHMDRLIPAPKINMGVGPYGYYDENLGAYVGTNRERRELMRKQGVTQKGDTPKTGDAWV